MGHITISVGRLLCRPVRDFLEQAKFMGADIDFHESKGLFQRTFIIRGKDAHLIKIKRSLDQWQKDMEESECPMS